MGCYLVQIKQEDKVSFAARWVWGLIDKRRGEPTLSRFNINPFPVAMLSVDLLQPPLLVGAFNFAACGQPICFSNDSLEHTCFWRARSFC